MSHFSAEMRVGADQYSERWPDLAAREEATDVGRRLDVGGFVFGDAPEAIFRGIGPAYVRDAWRRLVDALGRRGLAADELAWGLMHPGETSVAGLRPDDPCRFIGWTGRHLAEFDADSRWGPLDAELGGGSPSLRCAVTWRSLRWRIGGDETALGLRLFEAITNSDSCEWAPEFLLAGGRDESEPWVRVARAVRDADQNALDRALAAAERSYSPLGFRIVVGGYRGYAEGWNLALRFPTMAAE